MEIQKWEYKSLIHKATDDEIDIELDLNSLGKEGWELVDVAANTYKTNVNPKRELQMQIFYFKRPVQPPSDVVFTSEPISVSPTAT